MSFTYKARTVNLNIYLSQDQNARLAELAAAQGITKSRLISEVLHGWIQQQPVPPAVRGECRTQQWETEAKDPA